MKLSHRRPFCGCRNGEPWDGVHFFEKQYNDVDYDHVITCSRGHRDWLKKVDLYGGFYWIGRWHETWVEQGRQR